MAEMSKVEQVARAMLHAECETLKAETGYGKLWGWDDVMPAVRARHLAAARVAIEAMRNLSPELKSAGAAAFFSPMPTTHEEENERAASIFRRVIDAALSEEVAG